MKSRLFKSLLVAAVAVIGFTALPTPAEAGGSSHRSFSHKCGSCGGSIYKKRVVSHRDRCGRPVYRWNRISHRCAPSRPPVARHRGSCGHGQGCNSCGRSNAAPIIFGILSFIAEQSRNDHGGYDDGYRN
jgi:hypothetical protein